MAATRLTRWAILLNEYDYSVSYLSEKFNAAADCLSRLHLPN